MFRDITYWVNAALIIKERNTIIASPQSMHYNVKFNNIDDSLSPDISISVFATKCKHRLLVPLDITGICL